jgi:hypothetical protein
VLLVNLLEFLYPLQGTYFPRGSDEPIRLHPGLVFAYAGILAGIWRCRGRPPGREDPRWIPIAMSAAYLAVSMAWNGLSVYRLPVEPILLAGGLWGWSSFPLPGAAAYALAWVLTFAWSEQVRRPLTETVFEWLRRLG